MSRVEFKRANYLQVFDKTSDNSAGIQFQPNYHLQNSDFASFNGNKETKNKKPSLWAKVGGFFAGSAVFGLVNRPLQKITSKSYSNFLEKIPQSLSLGDTEKVAKVMVEKSGIGKKGFKHMYINGNNVDEAAKVMEKEFSSIPIIGKKMNSLWNLVGSTMAEMISEGKDARFFPNQKIAMAGEKSPEGILHEIGHAINTKSGKFVKGLITTNRVLAKVAPAAILLVGLLHTNNNEDKKGKGFLTKSADFIKDNAGTLAFLSAVPMLFEEGLASAHGLKYARKVLGKTAKLGGVRKRFAAGFASYAVPAGITALAINAGIWVRDKIVQPKPVNAKQA